jgi:hypothetical protein
VLSHGGRGPVLSIPRYAHRRIGHSAACGYDVWPMAEARDNVQERLSPPEN